jgi:PQQ-dependent dehydrogenase (methanol/ethanol family)
MKRCVTAAIAAAVVWLGGAFVPAAAQRALTPVTDAMLRNPDPADWLMWRRTLNSWGYSPLDQIDRSNVARLQLIWSRPLGPGLQEGTPLVHDGVMFMPSPADFIQAINAATGDLLWEYRRKWPDDVTKVFPVPGINRNLAIYGTAIIDTSADDYVFALDALSGNLLWETQIVDFRKNAAQETSGPIIANGKIISTRGCEPKGGPEACVITAHDAKTGKELWRRYTIPRPGEPGNETWGDIPYENRWHVGAWMVPSYDPELNLLYVGTSVTSPAPKFMLAGNNKQYLYHNCTLALNADTGKIVWYYQHIVDHWDLDHPFERLLVDTAVRPDPAKVRWINPTLKAGERRKVVTGIPGKTGVVYTLDRQTGEFLWATPTVSQNVISGIDGAGAVTVNPASVFTAAGQERLICPGVNGGKNWPAGAYSPLTNTMYYPLQNACMAATSTDDKPSLRSLYAIATKGRIADGTDKIGTVQAISAETGAITWKYEQRSGMLSLVATGGGLIFGGDASGRFRAFDQKNGKVLWETNLGAPVTGYPVTFAVGGRQYVAASTGPSLLTGGLNALTPEVQPANGNSLFVFALPGNRP